MPLKVLVGESASGRSALVDSHQSLHVATHDPVPPPVGSASRFRYFSALLGSTGADSGVTNMNVNGAVTAQEFFVAANDDFDIRIMNVVVVIADTAIVHNRFGNVTTVATGWDLKTTEDSIDTFLIEKATTGGQVIAQSGFTRPYGDGAQSFELLNWTGTEDAQTVSFPLGELVPGGVRLGRGTEDRVVSVVNDDLTGLTEFTVRLLGYRHFP